MREITRSQPALSRNYEALGPAVFKSYQQRVEQLLHHGAQRLVIDGLDPRYAPPPLTTTPHSRIKRRRVQVLEGAGCTGCCRFDSLGGYVTLPRRAMQPWAQWTCACCCVALILLSTCQSLYDAFKRAGAKTLPSLKAVSAKTSLKARGGGRLWLRCRRGCEASLSTWTRCRWVICRAGVVLLYCFGGCGVLPLYFVVAPLSALLPLPHMSSTASTLLARDRWCAGTRPCAEVCGGCFAALSDAGPAPARAALPVGVSPANLGAKTPALACSFCNLHRRRRQQQQQQRRIVLLRHRLHIQAVTAPLLAAIPFPLNVQLHWHAGTLETCPAAAPGTLFLKHSAGTGA